MKFSLTNASTFLLCYGMAMGLRPEIAEACTAPEEVERNHKAFYLSACNQAGFAVGVDGELCYVFSTERGKGDDLMVAALTAGATHLDCFDGYLPHFYKRWGFVEVSREPNWTDGPDVVYMERR